MALRHVRHSGFAPPRTLYRPLGVLMVGRIVLEGAAALQRALAVRRHARLRRISSGRSSEHSGSSAESAVEPRTWLPVSSALPSATPCSQNSAGIAYEWLADGECPLCADAGRLHDTLATAVCVTKRSSARLALHMTRTGSSTSGAAIYGTTDVCPRRITELCDTSSCHGAIVTAGTW